MPIGRKEAERSLELLWEFMGAAEDPQQRSAYEQAIQSFHVYLTDVLPASQPCVRAKVKDGFVELPRKEDEPVKLVEINCDEGATLGVSLDSVNVVSPSSDWGGSQALSPIVVSWVKPSSAAAREGTLHRGDQVLQINGQSLAQVSLDRARWLLSSAERSKDVRLAIIPSGLFEGLKHSVSRSNLLDVNEPHRQSRSVELMRKGVKMAGQINGDATVAEILNTAELVRKSRSDYAVSKKPKDSGLGAVEVKAGISSRPSLHDHPLYTPSIGSRGSNQSLVSSTVEMAAHLARSSMRSSRGRHGAVLKRRKVRKMHIMKGATGLGLRIVGGKGSKYGDMGIYVSKIEEGGAAHKDGRLKPSDELLMVDGKSLVGLNHQEAVAILTSTQQLVQLVVATEVGEGQSINTSLQSIPERISAQCSLFGQQTPGTRRALLTHLSSPPNASPSDVISRVGSLSPGQTKVVSTRRSLLQAREAFMEAGGVKKRGNMGNLAALAGGNGGGNEAASAVAMEMKSALSGTEKEENGLSGAMETETQNLDLAPTQYELMKSGPSKVPLIQKSENLQFVQTVTQWGRLSPRLQDQPQTPEPEIKTFVYVKSGGRSLGFTICGGKGSRRGDIGIYVRTIKEGSIAEQDGRLNIGDELLEVNGKSLQDCSHKKAASIIRGLKTNVVTLKLHSRPSGFVLPFQPHTVSGVMSDVTIAKEPGTDLGVEVIGVQFTNCNQLGAMIKKLKPGSPAALCGKLHRCDQVIDMNETSLLDIPVKRVEEVFASLPSGEVRMKVIHPQAVQAIEAAICQHEEKGSEEEYVMLSLGEDEPSAEEGEMTGSFTKEDEQDDSSSTSTILDTKVPTVESSDEESEGKTTETEGEEPGKETTKTLPKPKPEMTSTVSETASDSMEARKEQALAALMKMTRVVTQAKRVGPEDESSEESSEEEEGGDTPPDLPASPPPPIAPSNPSLANSELPQIITELVSASSKDSTLDNTDDEDDSTTGTPHLVAQQSLANTGNLDSGIQIAGSVPNTTVQSPKHEAFPVDFQESNDMELTHSMPPPVPASPPPSTDHFSLLLPTAAEQTDSSQPPLQEGTSTDKSNTEVEESKPFVEGSQIPPGFIHMDLHLKKRARSGLGITVVASSGVTSTATKGYFMVRRIMAGGVAAKDGRLRPGDRLVMVNGKTLCSLSHAAVLQAINDAPKDCHLTIWRDPDYDIDATSSIYSIGSRSSIFSDEDEGTEGSGSSPKSKRHSASSFAGRDPLSLLRRDSRGNSPLVSSRHSTSVMDQLLPTGSQTSPPGKAKRWSVDMVARTGPVGESLSPPNSTLNQHQLSPLTPSPPSSSSFLTPLSSPTTAADTSPEPYPSQTLEYKLRTDRDSGSEAGSSTSTPPELPSSPPPPPPAPPSSPPPPPPPLAPPSTLQRGITPAQPLGNDLEALEGSESEDEQEDEANGAPPLPPTTPPPPPPPDEKDDDGASSAPQATRKDDDDTAGQGGAGMRPLSMSGIPKGERVEHGPFEIEVIRGIFGLGLSVGTNDSGMIVVKALSSRSPIAKNGNINVGDILLAVNDISLTKETTETATVIIKGLPRGPVKFVVMAPPRDITGKGLPTSVVTTSGKSVSTTEEGIVKAVVTSIRGQPLGFEIEGGSDTPLQYTYVKSLTPNSPAEALRAFRAGDQLVMVGEECLIGLTTAEARKVLENSDGQVEIVAQRKPSPQQTPGGTPTTSTTDMRSSSRLAMRSRSSSTSSMASNRSHSGSVDMLHTSYSRGSGRDLSQRSASRQSSEVEIRDYLVKQEQMATLVPEETHTIELTKTPKQKLGLAVVGGTDNPNLKEVHVRQVLDGGIAQKDGRLKRGDRIVSVNGQGLAGMDNKSALLVLRNAGAGEKVTLVVSRKLGRRTSLPATPMPGSNRLSRRSSGEQTKAASGAGSQGGSEGSSPPRTRASLARTRRTSSTDSGDRVGFASSNTMPRKLNSMVGLKVVELRKGPTGLGIQLMGGRDTADPVTVKLVFSGGPAHKSGKIHPGDMIIEANRVSFDELTHDEAIKTMKGFPQGKVSLLMRDRAAVMANAMAACGPPISPSNKA